MRKIYFHKIIALLLAVFMLAGSLAVLMPSSMEASADTTEKEDISRLINVVYDDSNSMLMYDRLWWCYAKYSLEVFSAMMQSRDTMNIYYMSQFSSKSESASNSVEPIIPDLSGDPSQQKNNIDKIHETVTYTRGTPFNSIKKAYKDLAEETKVYDEKWLVVITDGDSFDAGEGLADLDSTFANAKKDGVKVVYLAIGSDLTPTEKQAEGIYVYTADGDNADGSDGILANVTEICQKIFQRPSIEMATSNKLKLDVPVSEIIVFAQGSNVSVGNISGMRKNETKSTFVSGDKNAATTNSSYLSSVKTTDLSGTIVTFKPSSGSYLEEGTYDLPVSADEYAIYYKPALDVTLSLRNEAGATMVDKYIPEGSYTLEYWLTYPKGHPKYGEKIPTTLFDIEYERYCTVNGTTRELTSNKVDLKSGDTEIEVIANYLNFISNVATLKYVVEDFTVEVLTVSLDYNQKEYDLYKLDTENEGIKVKVQKNGADIPASDWERFTVRCEASKLDFRTVKNNDSSFTIYPKYFEGDLSKTATGDIPITVTVSASNDHRPTDEGVIKGDIKIVAEYDAEALALELEYEQQDFDLSKLESSQKGVKVNVKYNGSALSDELWSSCGLVSTAEKMNFEIVKNNDSSFTVYPRYFEGNSKNTATGDIQISFTASVQDEFERVTHIGTASGKINVFNDMYGVKLGISIEPQSDDPCDNKNFNSQNVTRKVTFDWAGRPLTKEQYDALKLSVKVDDKDINASIVLDPYVEGGPTTATITFKAKDVKPKKLHGDHEITVNASAEIGEINASGSSKEVLDVKDARTAWEKFLDILPYLIALLIILFLCFAYIPLFGIKRYLPTKIHYKIQGVFDQYINTYSNAKAFFSAICPFKKVEITLGAGNNNISIKASHGKTVECTNIEDLHQEGVRINSGRAKTFNLNNARFATQQGKIIATFSPNPNRGRGRSKGKRR